MPRGCRRAAVADDERAHHPEMPTTARRLQRWRLCHSLPVLETGDLPEWLALDDGYEDPLSENIGPLKEQVVDP